MADSRSPKLPNALPGQQVTEQCIKQAAGAARRAGSQPHLRYGRDGYRPLRQMM
jgi:hypothetical protein